MPFVSAEDGVRIHYQVAGAEAGTPLVMHHGVYSDHGFWQQARRGRPSYVESLSERFRLILLDARGHGLSDHPTRAADYDFRTRVLDVVAVLDAAGVRTAHLFGYSMGAHVGMSAAIYAPQRFRSLVLGGASPFGAVDFSMSQRPWDETWPHVRDLPHAHREAWGAVSEAQWRFRGAVQALRTTALPFVLFAGERDAGPHRGIARFAAQGHARAVDHFIVPQANHLEAATRLDEVVPRLVAFVDQVEAVRSEA